MSIFRKTIGQIELHFICAIVALPKSILLQQHRKLTEPEKSHFHSDFDETHNLGYSEVT